MVKLLSIVIPYYETYDYITRLLKELSLQATDDIEIIVVDDGCNEARLDEFKHYMNNFHIVHLKENSGVSKARNIGVQNAQGKYISFIDSDDMITMDYIEQLLKLIKRHDEDVIYFNWLDITNNSLVIHPSNPAVWKAIYKKEIVPLFDETMRVREDYFWQKEIEKNNPTKYYYNRVLYIYNSNREGSLWWNETHK